MTTDNNTKNVVAIGKFDGMHLGHQRLIKTAASAAKQNGMKTLVYVIAPSSGKVLTDFHQKEFLMKANGADKIIKQDLDGQFRALTPELFMKNILINQLNAGHVAVGYNFRFGVNRCGDVRTLANLCSECHIGLTVLAGVSAAGEPVSSTRIKKLLDDGKTKEAKDCLGRYYSIDGCAAEGKHLGRKIGFPTVNLYPGDNIYTPRFGVYAAKLYANGSVYNAVTNVGINPTVDDGKNIKIESHILNYKGKSMYGSKVSLEFIEFVRPEIKFTDIGALKSQIEKDKKYVKNLFE